MSDKFDDEKNSSKSRSWLEKLGAMLTHEPQNREQLRDVLRDAEERDIVSAEMLGMIERILQVSEMQVREVMVPRAQMIMIEKDSELSDLLPIVIESGHSRFPVIDPVGSDIIGMLLAKDILKYVFNKDENKNENRNANKIENKNENKNNKNVKDERDGKDNKEENKKNEMYFDIATVMRPPVFTPQSKRLDILLREFRVNRNHIAIVLDEYGHVAGLVTIEDVLEQIVGEIDDEYDFEEDDVYIKKHSDDVYIVKAQTPVNEFNEYFHSEFSEEEFDTIGGIVLQHFGHLPKRGETCKIKQFRFKVLHSDNRRIYLLEVKMVKKKKEVV